uniref:Receptor-like serine/threonine-protein kinase n=1 Tax=Leersia perrieri TaxID=77586 RepID=A0A0D9WGJ8_9ORYZ
MAAGATPRAFIIVVLVALCALDDARAADTVASGRPLSGHQRLVSLGGKFDLGFFHPDGGVAGRWYVGIWYNNISPPTPVWVANRRTPVSDPATSRLAIAPDGNLALFDRNRTAVWSTNVANATATVAILLDTGNLVLVPTSSSTNASAVNAMPLCEPAPSKAWYRGRSPYDPTPGEYALQLDPSGAPQYVLMWNGTREYWATGNWTGRIFAGAPEVGSSSGSAGYTFRFVDNDAESYFTYDFADESTVYRFVMDASGQIKGWFWVEAKRAGNLVYAEPKSRCAVPRGCGAFGVCSDGAAACGCVAGDRRAGTLLNCGGKNGSGGEMDRFLRMDGVRLPDDGIRLDFAGGDDGETACLVDCSCSAYAFNGSCVVWRGDLLNLQDGLGGGGDGENLYLRLAASELSGVKNHHKWSTAVIAIGAASIASLAIAAAVIVVHVTRRRRIRARIQGLSASGDGGVISFKYSDLQFITNNFSTKLGSGAFGSVFRGTFPDDNGMAVAVKKLEGLRQGEKQFRAEVSTLATVRHVNLIRLLGFCSSSSSSGDRKKLLVYEYMPHGSLDRHLFVRRPGSPATPPPLSWAARYRIAVGVAKGLAYLHGEMCRDRVIHCNVKPENILLDAGLSPKVADFGLPKLVGRDFSRVLTTMRGTVGYLEPEWISGEAITPKADVFSYGMTLLEIVSGRRNAEHVSSSTSTSSALFFPVVVARRIAEEGDDDEVVMELLDEELDGEADAEEVRRVCKVACWCIQDGLEERPTMAEVVQALEGVMEFESPPVPRYLEVLAGGRMPMHETMETD